MAGIGDYLAQALLNYWNKTNVVAPANFYVGLFPSDPGGAGTGSTEISGNAYVREIITFHTVAKVSNIWTVKNQLVLFPTATPAGWGLVAYAGFFDALTLGNFLGSAALTISKTVGTGDTFEIPDSNFSLQIS